MLVSPRASAVRRQSSCIRDSKSRGRTANRWKDAPSVADCNSPKRIISTWRAQIESSRPSPRHLPQVEDGIIDTAMFARLPIASFIKVGGQKWSKAASLGHVLAAELQTCQIYHNEFIFEGPDICGNARYNLTASVAPPEASFYGFWWAFGTCTGGFTNCFGNYESQAFQLGRARYQWDGPPWPGTIAFHWELDIWQVETNQCLPSAPEPCGLWQVTWNSPYPTPVYYLDCP